MIVEMAKVKGIAGCTISRPRISNLGELQATLEDVKLTYEPWLLIIRWLGMYFPQAHGNQVAQTCFSSLIPYMATISLTKTKTPSRLFWSQYKVSMRLYHVDENPAYKLIKDDTLCILIYQYELQIVMEVYRLTRFYHQLHLNQFGKVHLSGCQRSLVYASSYKCSFAVPVAHLVQNVNIHYARWWVRVAGVLCQSVHKSHPPPLKKKGSSTVDPPLYRSPPQLLPVEENGEGEAQKEGEGAQGPGNRLF